MNEASSLWGHGLAEYVTSYNMEATSLIPVWDKQVEIFVRSKGQEGIREICSLVGNQVGKDLDTVARKVTLGTLHSVLALGIFPQTFPHLASPPLISACIRLMSTVKRSGKPSPFSFEYGFICFRIILLALGACLLKRTHDLENTLQEMALEPEIPALQIFTEHVAGVVQDEMDSASGRAHCDWVLGWGPLKNHGILEPLVPRSVTSMLFDLLWEDRKFFLKALVSTFSPGLTGLLFLLWRYWRLERIPNTVKDDDSITRTVSPLCEILWRCGLVVATDQEYPVIFIHNDIARYAAHWRDNFIDLEDCRTIGDALNRRLVRAGLFAYAPINPTFAPALLIFVTPYIKCGAEDLMPSLIGRVIDRLWEWLTEKSDQANLPFVDAIGTTLSAFSRMVKCLDVLSDVAVQLIDTVIEGDLLGLIVRLMTLQEPIMSEAVGSDHNRFSNFLECAETFYDTLCSLACKRVVQSKFHDSFREWLKYRLHFYWRIIIASVPDDEDEHWTECGASLDEILESIGQRNHLEFSRNHSYQCRYARCPDPHWLMGARFACSKCFSTYCSATCQAMDWTQGGWQKTHKELCPEIRSGIGATSCELEN